MVVEQIEGRWCLVHHVRGILAVFINREAARTYLLGVLLG